MWSLSGRDIVDITSGNCSFEKLENLQINSTSTDSRKIEPGCLFIAIKGDVFDGHAFISSALDQGAALVLANNSWSGWNDLEAAKKSRIVRVDNVTNAFRTLAATFRRRFSFPVVGIGGSNGKTTTKEMLAALLSGQNRVVTKTSKSENGFLGLAITLTQKQHNIKAPPHALVLEIGIDEKDAMQEHIQIGSPDVVLLTHLGPEHLAGLGNWETAIAEEYKLFSLSPTATRIWQLADEKLVEFISNVRSGDILVGESQKIDSAKKQLKSIQNISFLAYDVEHSSAQQSEIKVNWYPGSDSFLSPKSLGLKAKIPLPGQHNVDNFILALGAALSLGITPTEALDGWTRFIPPDMRSRIVQLKNITLYDDCYNASPSSMEAALSVLQNPDWRGKKKIAILGDMLDLGVESKKWHLELASQLVKAGDLHLCLYGDAMYDVFQYLRQQLNNVTEPKLLIYKASSENPRDFLTEIDFAGDCVLLVKGSRGMGLERVTKTLSES